jgi:hypothetical protein
MSLSGRRKFSTWWYWLREVGGAVLGLARSIFTFIGIITFGAAVLMQLGGLKAGFMILVFLDNILHPYRACGGFIDLVGKQ